MRKNENINKFIVTTILLPVLILLYNSFSIFIEYYLGTFTVMILFIFFILSIGIICYSFVNILVYKNLKLFFLILLCSLSLVFLKNQTLRSIGLNLEFNLNKDKRLQIIEMIKNNTFEVGETDGFIDLPKEFKSLSKYDDGKVVVDKTSDYLKVCFFTSGGLFKNHDVAVYFSADKNLKRTGFEKYVYNVSKKTDHWYVGKMNMEK
ncbi:hypothetical protein Q428_06335 [Fervidicella metallireducens AeB]|uniref:Uncharacterized protein n=1 Tax=Fervidicella metallireducens AeB TaxID=1403537 RepID=A0A017RXU3_9CLOT|nr:hypothetical protein [Fervidicella metallireducens]EYE88765.1 hypothetical protein Q428_06335 [Fervidicella metallireducens AeB]